MVGPKTAMLVAALTGLLAGTAVAGTVVYDVTAYIDGRDQLVIQGGTMRWHHFDYAAVGRLGGANYPTTITTMLDGSLVVNAYAWIPTWPEEPPADIRYEAWSSAYNLAPPLWSSDVRVDVQVLQSRGPLTLVQTPTSSNGYTLVLEFNDNNYGNEQIGWAAWYRARVTVTLADEPVFTDDFSAGARSKYWTIVQSPGNIYDVDTTQGDVRFTKARPNPGGQQIVGLRLNLDELGGPLYGDFTVDVDFSGAQLSGGGVDQVLIATHYIDNSQFCLIRGNEPSGQKHAFAWTGSYHAGFDTSAVSGRLRVARVGSQITGYLDGQYVWGASLSSTAVKWIFFYLQNAEGSNDNTFAIFDNFRVQCATVQTASLGPVFTDDFATGLNPQLWWTYQTAGNIYDVDTSQGDVRITKARPTPGGEQTGAVVLKLDALGGPLLGNFMMDVNFSGAVLPGPGTDQVHLVTYYDDGKMFANVRDNSTGVQNVHVWTGSYQTGFNTTATAGRLRILRTASYLSGYLDHELIWTSDFTTAALSTFFPNFNLQNNLSSNDNTFVIFDDFRLEAANLLPTGVCCYPSGLCAVTTEATCTGIWHSEWLTCAEAACPQPTAACCHSDGTCSVTTQAECTGVWHAEWADCSAAQCPCVCMGDYDDDFSDGALSALFDVWAPCGTVQETGGQLVLTKTSGCVGSCVYYQKPDLSVLCGDFDISIDFALSGFTVPATVSRWAGMQVLQPGQPPLAAMSRYLRYAAGDCAAVSNYKAYGSDTTNCGSTMIATTDTVGKFRITRVGATLNMYYWSGGVWQLLRSHAGSTENVRLELFTATDYSASGHAVAFDNLAITSQACPSAACCYPDGTCATTVQAACTGIWHSEWLTCAEAACPQPTAACCHSDGTCSVTTQAECTGVWHAEWADCSAAQCPCVWVLSETKISQTAGGFGGQLHNSDTFGWSSANIGDLDGDGITDLAVGAFQDDDGGTDRGSVWILFMNANGTVKNQQKISSTAGGFTGQLDNGDYFGHTVAALGDLDGDGTRDLAVGAHFDDDGSQNRGAVWILFLNPNGTVNHHQKISATAGGFTGQLDTWDCFGVGVASLGDLDGDGISDLAVGAHCDDDGGLDRGAVWILFMNRNGTVRGHQKISATAGGFTGQLHDSDNFGHAAAALGDLDGDGVGDLVAGAFPTDDGGPERGAVWILFLHANGTVKGQQKISATAGGFTGQLDDGDRFGMSVAALDDLDGDGIRDLAVGALYDDDGGQDRGATWILFMNTNGTVKAHQKISATAGGFTGQLDNSDLFGGGFAALGDLNNDGLIDLVVGAHGDDDGGPDRGAVWILNVSSCPQPPANDLCTNPQSISPPYPLTVSGTTVRATLDCPGFMDVESVWYKVELPYAVNRLSLRLCGDGFVDHPNYVYYSACDQCLDTHLVSGSQWNSCSAGGLYGVDMWWDAISGPGYVLVPVGFAEMMGFDATFDVQDFAPLGACCFPDGHCEQLLQAACTAQSGLTWSEGLACEPNPCTLMPGDCDGDFDVDIDDFSDFVPCFLGPEQPLGTVCECFDLDPDTDVDLADFATFQRAFTGS